MKQIFLYTFAVLITILSSCNSDKNTSNNKDSLNNNVSDTSQTVQLPKKEFIIKKVEAQKAVTLKYESGAKVNIPENCFVDENGNDISGEVDIKFKEISTPLDMIAENITMQYDSAGTEYIFESAAMCRIEGFQNEKPIFIKEGKEITVELPSPKAGKEFNLYQMNPRSNQWEFIGKDEIIEIEKITPADNESFSDSPKKRDSNKPSILIKLKDRYRFKEYGVFDEIRFEFRDSTVSTTQASFNKWIDFEIKKKRNYYTITFMSYDTTITYEGYPVFDGMDYQTAMNTYDVKYKEYVKNQAANNEAANKREFEYLVYRKFKIYSFGIINCDRPYLQNFTEELIVKFYDKKNNKPLNIIKADLIYKKINSRFQSRIRVNEFTTINRISTENNTAVFCSFSGNKFGYINEEEITSMVNANKPHEFGIDIFEMSDINNSEKFNALLE